MRRRQMLGGVAALGAVGVRRARAEGRDPRELRFITLTGLTVLDPVWTASLVTLNHAYHVYDTLYGIAQDLSPRPQMVACFRTISGPGLSGCATGWRFMTGRRFWGGTRRPR